jgi:hypothetical protein
MRQRHSHHHADDLAGEVRRLRKAVVILSVLVGVCLFPATGGLILVLLVALAAIAVVALSFGMMGRAAAGAFNYWRWRLGRRKLERLMRARIQRVRDLVD